MLAKDVENATEIYKAANGHVLIGVLSKNYDTVEAAVTGMREFATPIENAVSIGLGAGDPNQWKFVGDIAREYKPKHINQVFTGVGYTRATVNNDETLINSLVSPSGKPGYVTISTGPLSSRADKAVIPIHTAIAMMKDMGANSIKFFPMNGLATIEEYKVVVEACAKEGFGLEPTGGIDLENVEEIVEIALKAGVERIIPHVYSSIINKETGNTNVSDVEILYNKLTALVDKYQS